MASQSSYSFVIFGANATDLVVTFATLLTVGGAGGRGGGGLFGRLLLLPPVATMLPGRLGAAVPSGYRIEPND